jgi:hypothetical protein
MNLHHSVDPRLWNLSSELRLLGLGGPRMTRRDAIRRGLVGTAGLALSGSLAGRAFGAPSPPAAVTPKAKSVIQIWLWGGACHLDTFDPKPDAGYDYYGALKTPIPRPMSPASRSANCSRCSRSRPTNIRSCAA